MATRRLSRLMTFCCVLTGLMAQAQAGPSVIVDVGNGRVLVQDQATRPWYPASLTKLMTAYVALAAVKAGRVSMDTPFIMSPRAARMAPSKMGFAPGTAVTLDNALKMLMVKSANDIAVMIAEGVSGSVEDFAAEMNATAAKLGLHESHFVNPNGLPDPQHVSSARDMAMIGRALYVDFPEHAGLFDIGALRLNGSQIIPTHNGLLGRYPGADGMKTGFICASGFNVVASASRGNHQLIAVVLGSPSAKARTLKVAAMLDAAFGGAYSFTAGPQLGQMPNSPEREPADIKNQVCGRHRVVQEDDFAVPVVGANGQQPSGGEPENPRDFILQQNKTGPATRVPTQISLNGRPTFEPIDVFVGPRAGYTGPVAKARDMGGPTEASAYAATGMAPTTPLAADPAAQPLKQGKGRKIKERAQAKRVAPKPAPKPSLAVVTPPMADDASDKPVATPTAKPAGKPATQRHAQAKPQPLFPPLGKALPNIQPARASSKVDPKMDPKMDPKSTPATKPAPRSAGEKPHPLPDTEPAADGDAE